MAIRLSGLNSGMDTDAIVQALMSAKSMKKTKIEGKKTKLEWKKDLWSELNTKIYSFYNTTLSKIKMQGAYKTKAATSSDTSKVTATATSSAAEGTYKVKVNKLASAQYVTSGKLGGTKDKDGNIVKASASTKLVDLLDKSGNATFTAGTQIVVQGKDGATSTLLVNADTKISDFVTTCQNVGLTASFDASQQRFFISSGNSGKDQGFKISAGALDATQQQAVTDWKNAIGYDYLSSTDKKAVNKIFDSLQAGTTTYDKVKDSLQSYLNKSQEAGVTAYYQKKTTDDYNQDYFTYDASGKQTGLTSNGEAALAAYSNQTFTDLQAKLAAANAMVTQKVAADMKTSTMKADILTGVTAGISDPNASSFLQASSADRATALTNAAQNYNSVMSSLNDAQGNIVGNAVGNAQLRGLGLDKVDGTKVEESSSNTLGMVVVEASDAEITFNGATLTSSNSNISVNGLTLEVLDKTDSEISISVAKDTSAIYDTIKDFISEYNSILKTMNDYYNASSAKGYDVLTDDQKEAMTDSEIEKWEDKIKSSLLRRDDTLSSLISSFRSNMMGTVTASNGKTYGLSSLGITTSGKDWYEGGLLHIKGDEDDAEYMDEENKLEKLLTEDPDLVMQILTGVTNNLYADLQKKSSSTTMSSVFTFYNDKEMNSQLSDYKKDISKWEKKLAALEDRYYKQFTAMEKAMAGLNSQQNYFSSMLG